jgi:hypothetical protein
MLGRPVQDIVGSVLDQSPPRPIVPLEQVDLARACLVGGASHCPPEGSVLDVSANIYHLPRREVDAHADNQARVCVEKRRDLHDPT